MNALIVGKFSPLHRGHQLVIDTALAECAAVRVLSWSAPEFRGFEAVRRYGWIRALYGGELADVAVLETGPDNDAPEDEPREFVARFVQSRGWPVDVVYTSEAYGDGFAAHLTRALGRPVRHRRVDQARAQVPVSGTALRADVHGLRQFLDPVVYADFVGTVAFVGAESTGKTTLVSRLAQEFGTVCVPEYGRTLWEEQGGRLAEEDFVRIARTHVAMTEEAKRSAVRWLFVDTTPLTTALFASLWHGRVDPEVARLARETRYDHLFLCEPDFGFVQDGTRSDPAFQAKMQEHFRVLLGVLGVGYAALTGTLEERVGKVREILIGSPPPAGSSAASGRCPVALPPQAGRGGGRR